MYNIKYINKKNLNINYLLQKNIIINKTLYNNINSLKNQIDDIPYSKWRLIRTIVTDYEFIGNHNYHNIKKLCNINYISRAYFKLLELLVKYENVLSFKKKKHINYVALAEAPGGFIKSFLDYRNKNDNITAISLKTENDDNINWGFNHKNIKYIYGDLDKNHNGNILNPEIIDYFCNYTKSVDFVTADGGFALNNNKKEMFKGIYHSQLFLCEIYITLKILNPNGNFILKIYDFSNKITIDLINILNKVFKNVFIEKPNTSREMNNENYIICLDYKPNHNITLKLYDIIVKMWNNPDLLLVNILKTNDKSLKNYLMKINNYRMPKQINKLKYSLLLNTNSNDELKKIFKSKYKYKLSLAYKWIKKFL